MSTSDRHDTPHAELAQAATVARAHYIGRQSKVDIAAEIGLSRFKVARLIDLAHAEGLVRIEVNDPIGVDTALSESIRDKLGISRAVVVDGLRDPRSQVGRAAAEYLHSAVSPGATVGLAWSRSTEAITAHLDGLPSCTIVQLCGVITEASGEVHNVELVRHAARGPGVSAVTFYAPLVLTDQIAAAALRKQAGIVKALRRCDNLSIAVIATGMWAPGESTVYDTLDPAESVEFARRGAILETCGILFDKEGKPLREGLQDRTIAINLAQLRRASDVVALASEVERVPAIIALARSGALSTLITHREIALQILAHK